MVKLLRRMKLTLKTFSLFLLLLKFNAIFSDEVSSQISLSEIQVNQTEKLLIKEQAEFKTAVKDALNKTKTVREKLKVNRNAKTIFPPFDNITNILVNYTKMKDYCGSNFQKFNVTGCRKLDAIISNLEFDMERDLKDKEKIEISMKLFMKKIDALKIEYFANFIFFNETQSEAVLAVVAMLEKFVDRIQKFCSEVYAASFQLSNILYDLKCVKYRICEPANNQKSTKGPAKGPAITVAIKKTTTQMKTTTVAVKSQNGEWDEQDDK